MINKLGIMKKGKVWRKVAFALGMLVFLQGQAQKRTFVHPGITYTQADLDRPGRSRFIPRFSTC